MRPLAPALLALLFGCGHGLEPGQYHVRAAGAPELDTCALVPASGVLPDLHVTVIGEQLRVDFDLFGGDRPIRMIGKFQAPQVGEPDGFNVDGSVINRSIAPGGVECLVPFGQIHVTAAVGENNSSFTGLLTIHHELARNQDPRCPLVCDVRVRYAATLAGD